MEPEAIDRERDHLLHRFRRPHVVGQRHPHGAHFVDSGVVVAAGHVDGRYAPSFQTLGELDGLFDRVPAGLVVGAAQTHTDRVVGTDLGFDLLDDLEQEAHPVLERPAIPVGPLVAVWREEVGDEVAVAGMDLHHVEPGRLGPLGRLAEGLDDLLDLVDGQGHRDGAAGGGDLRPGDVGGGLGLLEDEPLPARMGDLDGRPAPFALIVSAMRDSPGMCSIRAMPSWQGDAWLASLSTQAYSTMTMAAPPWATSL